jgi:hypothetical protein
VTTPLHPTFRKRIEDATERIIRDQVTPWAFLTAGPPFKIKQFSGREISYQGIGFEGSPRTIFWGRYIDPFLEALAIEEIELAVSSAKERKIDATLLLPEVQSLLNAAVQKVFREMAGIDRRLLGKGFPETVPLRSTEGEAAQLSAFIEERVRCELEMWKPRSAVDEWYERNKFWVWLVGIVIGVAGLAVKLF